MIEIFILLTLAIALKVMLLSILQFLTENKCDDVQTRSTRDPTSSGEGSKG